MPRMKSGVADAQPRPAAAERPPVPILMYHEISTDCPEAFRKYVVTPRTFARQMQWLASNGYTPISVTALWANRIEQRALPPRPVIISFDDGYQDCVQHAGFVLQRLGFCGVMFAVAGLVGQSSRWLMRERGFERPLAGWADLRAFADGGSEVGGHTWSHPRLCALHPDEARYELATSREVLEQGLGRAVVHLAYPFGSVNASVRLLAAETGYHTACTTDIGVAAGDDDLLMLRRVPITGHDSLLDFVCRVRTGLTVVEAAKSLARRTQRAVASWA